MILNTVRRGQRNTRVMWPTATNGVRAVLPYLSRPQTVLQLPAEARLSENIATGTYLLDIAATPAAAWSLIT